MRTKVYILTGLLLLPAVTRGELPTDTPKSTNAVPVKAEVIPKPNLDRWQKFEAEFAIQTPAQDFPKRSVQTLKYQLDETTVAAQQFVDLVAEKFRFDYSLNELGLVPRTRRIPGRLFSDTLSNARLKSEIDVKDPTRAFVGIKLVLPIGD